MRTQFCFFRTMNCTFLHCQCPAIESLVGLILPSLFMYMTFYFPHCVKTQVIFYITCIFEHWCRGHMYFFVQSFSTYFFKRIMGCHLSYCFSSSVIFDVLCSIKFCEHFFHCFLHFILSSPPTHRLPIHTHTNIHTHTPFPF